MSQFNEQAIKEMLLRWYDSMDEHRPVESYRDLLAPEGLLIDLPPAPSRSFDEFSQWYQNNITRFFDGTHNLHSMNILVEEDRARADVDMNWTVRTWTPPEPRSTQLSLNLIAKIGIVPHPDNGRPVIQTYQAIDS